jgi:xylulokinase
MSDLVLGLDVGTQGTKALCLDVERRTIVARAASSYGLIEGLPPGAAEQHPDTWWNAIGSCMEAIGRQVDAGRIRAIGVSGQQHGFVPLDRDRVVIRAAKLWCDTSTAAEARELSERLGRLVPTGYTASKVLWLARHEPASFARLAHVLLPHDWVNLRLTGELACEAGDASGTGYLDVAKRAFDPAACAAVDERLAERLPPLRSQDEPIGTLCAEAAGALGLEEGLPVAPGSGDNMMSALGVGATRSGVCGLSLGTSATVFAHAVEPVVDPEGLIAPFCGAAGGWLPLLCVMNATGVLHEVQHTFAATGMDLAALTAAAARVAPGCDGLTFVPFLVGERVPDLPLATGSLLGLRPGLLEPGHLFRAALEGTACTLAEGVDRLRALGVEVARLRAVGGGARNDLWLELLADLTGAPIERAREPESAALGAALQAAWIQRRSAGERSGLDAFVEPFVHLSGEAVEPDPARGSQLAPVLERHRAALAGLYS